MKTIIRLTILSFLFVAALIFIDKVSAQVLMSDLLCAQLAPISRFCDDFNSGNADQWLPDGGDWSVINGRYVGKGTITNVDECGFYTYQSLIQEIPGSDVEIELDMKSVRRVDKLIVLRSTDSGNQIEINIRAERPGSYPADLLVQERSQCQYTMLTPEFSVLIPPHQIGQTIHVRLRLMGERIIVWIDDVLVLDQVFPFINQIGYSGLSVIDAGATVFDNVKLLVVR